MNPRYILNAKGVRFDGAVCEGGSTNPKWQTEWHNFEVDTENHNEVISINLYDGDDDSGTRIAYAEVKAKKLAKNSNKPG